MPKRIVVKENVVREKATSRQNYLTIKPKICCNNYQSYRRLENQLAVITAAHDRISKAVAIAYAKEGADLVLIYHHARYEAELLELKSYLETYGRKIHLIKSSTFDEYKCKKLFEQIVKKFGEIDILVNNFPIYHKIEEMDSHYLLKKNDTLKIQSLFTLGKLAHEYLLPNGVIINTASVCAYSQPDQLVFYSAMKAAIKEYTQEMHSMLEYYEKKIRVNGITTGFVWSDTSPEMVEGYENLPLHFKSIRPMHPCDIVPLFVFLASKESTIISGETLNTSGIQK